jgi:hypothetical protein
MSDRLDDLLRAALADAPDLEPRPAELEAVLEALRPRGEPAAAPAVRRPRWTWMPALRLAVASWAALVVVVGGVLAVPAGRAAIRDALQRLERFFAGDQAPGTMLADPRAGALNWLGDALPGTPRVLARAGRERLVAFRQQGSGLACLSLGRHATECGDLAHWRARVVGGTIAPLFTTPPDRAGRVALWGILGDGVARVEVRYRDGGASATAVAGPGFVVHTQPAREPLQVVARSADGRVLATAPLEGLRFRFCTRPTGCP